MIRNATPGDRVTIATFQGRKAGTIERIRPAHGATSTIVVVRTDDDETRYMHPSDVDPEWIPERNRRHSTGTPSRRRAGGNPT